MSRRSLIALVVLSVLALGSRVDAAPILDYFAGGGGEAWVGSSGLYVAPNDLAIVSPSGFERVRLVFSAGAPTMIEQRADGWLVYHFGGGTLSFYQDDRAVGLFPVLPFTYTLTEMRSIPQGIFDFWPDLDQRLSRPSTQPAPLGPGALDHALAEAMGVGQSTSGGEFVIAIDNLTPMIPSACKPWLSDVPDPFFHCGVLNYAFGEINATERSIPEPATVLLIGVGVAACARRLWTAAGA